MYVLLYNIPNYILVIFLFICWEEGEDEGKNRKKGRKDERREGNNYIDVYIIIC